ncbi:MAG: pyridine nucleotide-disulfide oxidoreductase [Verrucomicrobiales bacterium]|nr:pyridine nucleotide-disulfide oxidoreductase [Verrucomicrobiales bacterium]
MDSSPTATHFQILIVGGGTAGITVAARLKRKNADLEIAILDPAETHYYQPMWTLIGGGEFPKEKSGRPMQSVIPKGVAWLKEGASEFNPDLNSVTTIEGNSYSYDYLVVAAGIQTDWDQIPGLKEGLGKNGICSNYSFKTVDYTWECIRGLKEGTAIFTQPVTPVKCGGAPQKICYLAEDYFRSRSKVRDKVNVIFASGLDSIFAVPRYRATLEEVIKREEIDARYSYDLVSLNPEEKIATFKHLETGETEDVAFDMIHVTPPMSAPDFIKNSPLAAETGWVSVDKHSLRHTDFANVYAIGDCSNLPTSKTGAAIRKQAPALVEHLFADIEHRSSSASYNGYTSCPLVTGYGSLVMAEFDYDKNEQESFPIDQSKERWSMWMVKKWGLPWLYWNLMLKGKV